MEKLFLAFLAAAVITGCGSPVSNIEKAISENRENIALKQTICYSFILVSDNTIDDCKLLRYKLIYKNALEDKCIYLKMLDLPHSISLEEVRRVVISCKSETDEP
jgi:uncharacterized protein YceK